MYNAIAQKKENPMLQSLTELSLRLTFTGQEAKGKKAEHERKEEDCNCGGGNTQRTKGDVRRAGYCTH